MIRRLAACACAALLASPQAAAAQQPVFSAALAEFTAAIDGVQGDEGARIGPALDTMARALAAWEVSGASLEPLRDRAREIVLAPAAYARGYGHVARGEYREAIAEFRRVAATDPLVVEPASRFPSSSEAHRVLGLTYWARAQDAKAIEELRSAIRLASRDERSRIALARVLASSGRDAEAERLLLETVELLPDSTLAHWWLGWGYERLNRFADARRAYERAAAGVVAGRSQVYAMLGRLASSAADVEGSIAAFRRAVDVNPDDPILHEYLAGALLQQGRADEALAEFDAALRIDSKHARAHAGVGRIHLDAGRYEEAVTALRRAVDLLPNDVDARYALATALMRMGKTREAAGEFERVAEAQRQALAERRRTMKLEVEKEGAAFGAPQIPSR